MLTKITVVTGDPGTPDVFVPGNPGSPGRPARPAWSEVVGYTEQLECIRTQLVKHPLTGVESRVCVASQVKRKPIIVEHPADPGEPPTPPTPPMTIPGRPARLVRDFNLGWNSDAVSRVTQRSHCRLQYQCPLGVVGVIAGLAERNGDSHYREIEYGLYHNQGDVRVVENGVYKTDAISYVDADVFEIVRLGTTVTYRKNGAVIYTSDKPAVSALFVDCSLYSGGDKIL